MVYYLWLKNNEDYYERIYKTITDVLSGIGGISNAIIFRNIFHFYCVYYQ